ncbi:MAG: hypothetical protein ISR65_02410 [Bacteriovoracaceae bacterium]|nr:hypothetical protein [Bacteriovoracaceae bacterium]
MKKRQTILEVLILYLIIVLSINSSITAEFNCAKELNLLSTGPHSGALWSTSIRQKKGSDKELSVEQLYKELNRQLISFLDLKVDDDGIFIELLRKLPLFEPLEIGVVKKGERVTYTLGDKQIHLMFEESSYIAGLNNAHIFFYTAGDGSHRIIKVMEIPVAKYLHEVRMANLGQLLGAPNLYRHGEISLNNKQYLYLELSRQLPEVESVQIKLTFMDAQIKEKFMAYMSVDPQKMVEQIASFYVKALEQRVLPIDPDFLLSAKGEVAWIDTGDWQTVNLWDAETSESIKNIVAMTVDYLKMMDKDVASRVMPTLKKMILVSPRLDKEEQLTLLDNL